jgi:hypothetical protein
MPEREAPDIQQESATKLERGKQIREPKAGLCGMSVCGTMQCERIKLLREHDKSLITWQPIIHSDNNQKFLSNPFASLWVLYPQIFAQNFI